MAAALIAGCATTPAVPPGVIDVTGTWEGTWNGGAVGRGRITIDLRQSGMRVTGKLAMSGATAISATDGPVEGQITGDRFSFEQPGGLMEGEMAVKDDEMAGHATGRLKAALALRRQPRP